MTDAMQLEVLPETRISEAAKLMADAFSDRPNVWRANSDLPNVMVALFDIFWADYVKWVFLFEMVYRVLHNE